MTNALPPTIRLATLQDLPWLRQLHGAFAEETTAVSHYPGVDEVELDHFVTAFVLAFKNDPTFFCFVAVEDSTKTIVGYLGGSVLTRMIGTPHEVLTAHWLYVTPDWRGRGLARQLCGAGIAWVREHCPTVTTIDMTSGLDSPWAAWGFHPFLVHFHASFGAIDNFVVGVKPRERHDGDARPVESLDPKDPSHG